MEKVPLKDLKMRLSYWAERASKGETIEVTKHNIPYMRLVAPVESAVIVGSKVGQPFPPSPIKKGRKIDWQKYLDEDRGPPDD